MHYGDASFLSKAFYGADKAPGELAQQSRRGNGLLAMLDQEGDQMTRQLQCGDIGIEVHAANAFTLQCCHPRAGELPFHLPPRAMVLSFDTAWQNGYDCDLRFPLTRLLK